MRILLLAVLLWLYPTSAEANTLKWGDLLEEGIRVVCKDPNDALQALQAFRKTLATIETELERDNRSGVPLGLASVTPAACTIKPIRGFIVGTQYSTEVLVPNTQILQLSILSVWSTSAQARREILIEYIVEEKVLDIRHH